MEITLDILNYSRTATRELLIQQHSGDLADLHPVAKETLTVADAEELECGDWVVIIDGRVESLNSTHPFQIYARADPLAQ